MTTAEMVYARVKQLPEPIAREILDFVDFLTQREHDREADMMQAQSSSLARIWDNDSDDVYNDA